ncbi:MAG: DUF2927 domain-containing protein [Mucilaginibacter sp.]|uniref:DUF2927 domain-containing protein n=1 Tax=Mucilaginibacter sp. TaxID=1882438 RepID=UPI003266B8CC
MKNLSLIFLVLLILQNATAQKLTPSEVKAFKAVALTFDNPLSRTLIIRKWSTPIYYKIYGTENAEYDKAVQQEAASAFKQIRQLTGLQIKQVMADDSVNFKIMIGEPAKLAGLLSPELLSYFKKGGMFYYTTNQSGISSITSIVNPKQYTQRPHVRTIVQIQIGNGIGLFGKITYTDNSIFSATPTVLPINFKPEDALRIKTLYNPKILHGMTGKEVDEVLKGIE